MWPLAFRGEQLLHLLLTSYATAIFYCLATIRKAMLEPDSFDSEVSARHPILGEGEAAEVGGGTVGEGVRLPVVSTSYNSRRLIGCGLGWVLFSFQRMPYI